MIIIGIDPGLTGAIALLQDGKVLHIDDMPVMAMGKLGKRKVNAAALVPFLDKEGALAVMEDVHGLPGQGTTSTGSIRHSCGIVEGVCAALGRPLTLTPPSVWKRALGLLKAPKDLSRSKAVELYPAAAGLLKLKRHHGRAEALLLAHWLQMQYSRNAA